MTYRRWFLVGAMFALIGALLSGYALLYGNFSPRGYVENHYRRASSHDIGREAVAYAASQPPSLVAQRITKAWKPADEYVDASGIYLRYDDDSVVILPAAAGSLILLEKVGTAYPRYHSVVGGGWGWGRGSTVRGGGPGSGK